MCRLFPCIPIFRRFFTLKSVKECPCVAMLKIVLIFAKNVFINVERGYKPIGVLLSSKTHYYGQILNVEMREVRAANAQTQLDLFQEVLGEFCDSLENKDQIIRSTFINIKI